MRWSALVLLSACGFQAASVDAQIDARIDAAPDARAFDPASECPMSYDITLAGETSRYRMILPGQNFVTHSAACAADQDGDTHLVALDSANEVAVAQIKVNTTPGLDEGCAWVGGVQLRDQASDETGWLKITGGALSPIWASGEPNDGGDNVEDNQESFVFLAANRGAHIDVNPNPTFGAMCECDGKPIDPTAAAAIIASTP